MAKTTKTIKVSPGSELARLLEEAQAATLRLEKDGVHYQLQREGAEEQEAQTLTDELSPMTLEMAYGSVPALTHPLDFREAERIAKEEHVEKSIRTMQIP